MKLILFFLFLSVSAFAQQTFYLKDKTTENPVAYPSQEVLSKCETFIDLGETIKLYDRAWIELKSE